MRNPDRSFDENVYDLNAILHPGSVFDHPRDLLADSALSRAEKKAILASWASDAAAVSRAHPCARYPEQGGRFRSTRSSRRYRASIIRRGIRPAASRRG
jgi:hypothetical protein